MSRSRLRVPPVAAPARPPRPKARADRVRVQLIPSRPGQFDRVELPPTLSRQHLGELLRLEAKVLDHLARDREAPRTLMTNPGAVVRAAAPEASEGLLGAIGATARTRAQTLPAGMNPSRFDVGIKGRLPLPEVAPARPASPSPTPVTSLAGFDACLAVGAGPLGRTLAGLLEAVLGQLDPMDTVAGALRLVEVTASPAVAIDAANHRARVTVTATAELDTTPGSLPLGVEMLIDITIVSTEEGVEINEAGVQVQVLGSNLSVPADALEGPIAEAVGAVLPVVIPVALPGGDEDFCDIGLRNLAVAFLPGEAGRTAPSLSLFTTLLADSLGNIGALSSPLPEGADGGVFLDNFFLLSQIACEIQRAPELAGLGEPTRRPTRTDANPRFEWTGLAIEQEVTTEDGKTETIVIREVSVDIDGTDPAAKKFVVAAELTIKRTLFEAHVNLKRIPITIVLKDGAITASIGEALYDVDVDLTLVALIIAGALLLAGAVVGGIIAGLIGVIAGGVAVAGVLAAIVMVIFLVVPKVVGRAVENAVAGQHPSTVQVIPPPLVDLFGVIEVVDLVFDDLQLTGRMTSVSPSLKLRTHSLSVQQQEAASGPGETTFHRSETIEIRAIPRNLVAPVDYEWTFKGAPLVPLSTRRPQPSGLPPVGSGISSVEINTARDAVTLTNALGSDVSGAVAVAATDQFGRMVSASSQVWIAGSIAVPDDAIPGPKPDSPLVEE